jgi:hypothetical protein
LPRASFPLLLHHLAETRQDKFAIIFDLFIGERAKGIEEHSGGSLVGLSGFGQSGSSSISSVYVTMKILFSGRLRNRTTASYLDA